MDYDQAKAVKDAVRSTRKLVGVMIGFSRTDDGGFRIKVMNQGIMKKEDIISIIKDAAGNVCEIELKDCDIDYSTMKDVTDQIERPKGRSH